MLRMTTRFRTRAFLFCFIPVAVLLAGGFYAMQRFVQSTVRSGLRTSLEEGQAEAARVHLMGDLEKSRFLKVAGENAALKAGVELVLSHPGSEAARRTVEDQLREMGEHMGFDFLMVSSPAGAPLAAVVRQSGSQAKGELVPVAPGEPGDAGAGLRRIGGRILQVASVPLDRDDGNIGDLSVGEPYGISEFKTPAVLEQDGRAIESNIAGVSAEELDAALAGCGAQAECDLKLQGANWISLPVETYGGGYLLRSLENVDAAAAPIRARLQRLFFSLAMIFVLVALVSSAFAARSIEQPIAEVVSNLKNAVQTGVLPELKIHPSSVREIHELAAIFNRAAVSVREAGENLEAAYLEFTGSLANALDARDRYTAGHSWRVSQHSCAIAASMGLAAADVERIRIGALLHDIGKIGVSDSVLQKPGRLTSEEFALVKEHPTIGRRILEGVQGLAPFLAAVELHHENWDGTGYPKGQKGLETPIDARIIHVSDAYDAMTTNRSYRRGLSHEQAIAELFAFSGRQFDPRIVDVFTALPREVVTGEAMTGEVLAGEVLAGEARQRDSAGTREAAEMVVGG
jgi:HD-GYP domain-containing protein (c-di-GMP phosphodiesterase class II)